jgi:hypothetical protein
VPSLQTEIARHNGERSADKQLLLRQQLSYFAQQTGAVAPAGGVDCTGSGAPEIAEGQPLVCPVDETTVQERISDTLVALLASFKDGEDARIVPSKTNGLDVRVDGASVSGVDVKKPFELAGTASLGCNAAQRGRTFFVSFDVVVADRVVGTLPATAACGKAAARTVKHPDKPQPSPPPAAKPAPTPSQPAPAPSSPLPPPPAPVNPTPAAAVAPPPPPPSPAPVSPVPSPSPANAPASAPAAAAAPAPGQAAAAVAPQVEALPQVSQVRVDQDHAMVRARRGVMPPPAAITLGLGGALAFGWAAFCSAISRRRPGLATAPVQRAGRRPPRPPRPR